MDQIVCGGCRALVMYARGASSVRCLSCHTVSMTVNPVSTVRCGCCNTQLMYPSGSPSVKCAICQFINNVGSAHNVPFPYSSRGAPTMRSTPHPGSQVVVIENPISFDRHGKPVNNIVVGVTTKQRKT